VNGEKYVADRFKKGDTVVFEGEDLRLLGLEPSKNPGKTKVGRVVDVSGSTVTVRWEPA
jgi:hypothetical protein